MVTEWDWKYHTGGQGLRESETDYYLATVCIDTDEDFDLVGGTTITCAAVGTSALRKKLLTALSTKVVAWANSGSVTKDGVVLQSWDYANTWETMRSDLQRNIEWTPVSSWGVLPYGNQKATVCVERMSIDELDALRTAWRKVDALLTPKERELLQIKKPRILHE